MDNTEIRQKLKNSVDMAHVRLHLIIYICLLICGVILGISTPNRRYDPSVLPMAVGICAVCGLVFLIPSLGILFRIYKDVTGYRLYKATLSQPHGGLPRGFMYFTVVLEDPDGSRFIVNTNTIFQSYGTSFGPSMENYVNRTVTIAYNENTGEVVVLD